MADAPEPGQPTPGGLHKPLARLLRPLVRLLIRSGLTFPAACDLLRELYVHVADREFTLPGKPQTDSRVSLLKGIHRREVRRLRGAEASLSESPVALSRTSRIIARWVGGPPYSDVGGGPLPLPRSAADGPSFDSLVTAVTRDLRSRAVLDEWLDRRLVSLDGQQRVVLRQPVMSPRSAGDRQLSRLGRNLHDHVAAAVANLLSATPPFFERAVHYDGLSRTVARHLEDRSRALSQDLLTAADLDASGASEADAGGPWRWTVGVYVFTEDTRADAPNPVAERVEAET